MEVPSRELRNNTRSRLERVRGGDVVTITLNGKPAAALRPIGRRTRWMTRDEFVRDALPQQADPGLRRELSELSPETTDDEPFPSPK